jgi:hypothetical protein
LVLEHLRAFGTIESNHMIVSKTVKETISMMTSVMKVCDFNPMTDDEIKNSIQAMKDAHMYEAIKEMFNIYLSGVN